MFSKTYKLAFYDTLLICSKKLNSKFFLFIIIFFYYFFLFCPFQKMMKMLKIKLFFNKDADDDNDIDDDMWK